MRKRLGAATVLALVVLAMGAAPALAHVTVNPSEATKGEFARLAFQVPNESETADTVKVDEFMTIESYAHVHHIVSNVSGRLREDVTPIGAIRAVFPGGTITGCPKVRCMEIIAELEATGRGAYTG